MFSLLLNPAWVTLVLKGGIKNKYDLQKWKRIGFHHYDILCIFYFQIDALTTVSQKYW